MPNIQILSEEMRNLIAAGEVVERPASVVKELVENSIDAGASEIRIEIVEGGLKLISVSDNGCGMERDDLQLSVQPHATSKIRRPEDLQKIVTLGFRGEALPSISQVSRFTIASKKGGTETGHLLKIEGGNKVLFEEHGMADGTEVKVEELFYNVPARKKFARSSRTEAGQVKDMVERIALANSKIRFRLISDGREAVSAFSMDDQKQRASDIFGAEKIKQTRLCVGDAGEIRVYGLLGDPSIAKDGTKGIYWFVNRRPVRDKLLNHAVSEAYRSLLPRGFSPFSILFVDLPEDQVDVNVHPAKSEVKFLKSHAIHDFVCRAVKKALSVESVIEQIPPFVREGREGRESTPSDSPLQRGRELISPPLMGGDKGEGELSNNTFSLLRPIGQLHNSYLLCEGEGGTLFVIDQHAVHERIGYEKLKKGFERSRVESQGLLVPEVIEIPSGNSGHLEEALPQLNKIGWEIEHFGGDNFCVKAVPAILGDVNLRKVLVDMADDLAEYTTFNSEDDRQDHLMKVTACHAQVRAGDRLSVPEISHLLGEMDEYEWAGRCPHGRPAIFEISLNEVEKWFNRT